jgi:putative flavoprotein involved in K+ transport
MLSEQGVTEAVVIGAGAAGLGAAAELSRRGIEVAVLDEAAEAGASWRRRYDGLRLNSARALSGLRGAPIPWRAGRFPSRDAYRHYLASCVERFGLDLQLGVKVVRLDREEGGYRLRTSRGDLRSRCVVVATGYDRIPQLPTWPGLDSFTGELRHAFEYRTSAPFVGRDVLVVGTGNSGTEIAAQLAAGGAARVRLAMRTPVNILPRQFLGIPSSLIGRASLRAPAAMVDVGARAMQRLAFGDLERYGMPGAPWGVGSELRRKGLGPVIDGGFVAALQARRVSLVASVEALDGAEVVLSDGTRSCPDAVIAATGYRHGLEELVAHLGVLDPSGRPERIGGEAHPAAPGLYFNGYWQPLTGQIAAMRITSRRIGRAVAREHRRARRARSRPAACGMRRPVAS